MVDTIIEIREPDCMKTPGNEKVEYQETSLIVRFPGPRNVLSTSWLNGGYREDLTGIFNNQISLAACDNCHLNGGVKTYLESVAGSLLLDPATTSGLITRAEMKNTAIVSESFRDLAVCAIVTAGIDKNGVRAGDPASYYENGDCFEPVGGTINTILLINAALPEYAMVRALMTATEAKAAALQQLMARSIYSTGIATGSGTDMIAIVADPCSKIYLSDAGTHSKLGELIGKTVIQATYAALEKETGLSPASQCDALVRLLRYKVTEEVLWNIVTEISGQDPSDPTVKEQFFQQLRTWAKEPRTVAIVAAALHIVDEAEWGLIPSPKAKESIDCILLDLTGEVPEFRNNDAILQSLSIALGRLVHHIRRDE
jgi:adenosylcobinamide hydrolase